MNIDFRQKVIGIIAVVGALVVAATLAYFFNDGNQTGLSVSAPASETKLTIEQVFDQLEKADSLHAEAALLLHLPGQQNEETLLQIVTFDVAGDAKRNEDGMYEFVGDGSIEAQGRGTTLTTKGSIDFLSDAVVFRLSEIAALLNPSGSLQDKWTYVSATPLKIKNMEAVMAVRDFFVNHLVDKGEEDAGGQVLNRFDVSLTDQLKGELQQLLSQSTTGSSALGVVSRLLRAYDVKDMSLWVDPNSLEVVRWGAEFVESVNDEKQQAAIIVISLTDYGKDVVIERPPEEENVDSQIFADLFRTGEVQEVK